MKTTIQAAEIAGFALGNQISMRVIQKTCKILRFEKIGRDYLLTDQQIHDIIDYLKAHRPGRPKKSLSLDDPDNLLK